MHTLRLAQGIILIAALARIAVAAPASADSYTYDALARLQRVDYATGGSTTYTYDANGNLLAAVSAGTVDVTPPTVGRMQFALHEVTPNPMRSAAAIRFDLPEPARVRLALFDVAGREVARLVDGEAAAGAHVVRVKAVGLAPGLLFARLEAGGRTATRRLVVLR